MSNEFINEITTQIVDYAEKNEISDYNKITDLLRNIFDDASSEILDKQDVNKQHITSPNAVIEVKDTSNGQLYRRYLELEYEETANGIRLKGESLSGEPTEIVFLSNQSIAHIAELSGAGSDSPEHH